MLLQLLFPRRCLLCRAVLKSGETDLCAGCRVDSPEFSGRKRKIPFVDRWTALWYYEGTVRRSLLRYKFRDKRFYGKSYGRLLAVRLREQGEFDVITWIPLGKYRFNRRGYDQCALLAGGIGRELGKKPVSVLKKIKDNPPQSGITGAAQRKANVLGAYSVPDPEKVRGKRVLLVDDILTTGATAAECAKTLHLAGAKEVYLAAVAASRKY